MCDKCRSEMTRWERFVDWIEDVYWTLFGGIHRVVETNWDRLKYACERAWRGYDRTAYWGLAGYLTEIALPVLKSMRENAHGYPMKFNSMEEWQAELDKMIAAFQLMYDDDHGDFCDWMGYDEKGKFSQKKYKADHRIVKTGLKSFAEHYQNLWD